MQTTVSFKFVEHSAPPCAGGVTTKRLRLMVPLPHKAEQTDQADQSLSLQSTGSMTVHSPKLHGMYSSNGGHGCPPASGATMIVLTRF